LKLIINTPGTYLSKSGECFLLKNKQVKQEISARKVDQILITTHAALSTDVIELALQNNIDIIFLKNTGQPLGRIWHSKLGSITTIRRKQLFLQEHRFGLELVKDWLTMKLNHQVDFLNKLAMNRRDSRRDMIKESIEKIKNASCRIIEIDSRKNVDDVRSTLLGLEGSSSRVYFNTIGQLLPVKYRFEKRSRDPALDQFNCMLNYSYGILYSSVEKSCIIAGLDPYIGILHTDNYNKKALVFDIIEMYRGYMDEIVFRLFSTKKIDESMFDSIENGYYLNKEGKKALITEYNKQLEKKIRYRGRNIEFASIIQYDCHRIANSILEEDI
jgi:CRISPR-associated protein Cas1